MSSQDRNKNPLLCHDNPWNSNSNSIWLGSTITLNRNIEKFNFPAKLSPEKRKQVVSLLKRELVASPQLEKPGLIPAEEMVPVEKEFLVEHFLTNQSFHQASTGEAFVLDQKGEFMAVINLTDHLLLEWIDTKDELEAAWDRLVKIETKLNETVNFAFSPKFGFLTSDPTQCGTALTVQVFLHLPVLGLTGRLEAVLKKNMEDGIEQTGLQGNPNEMIGDIIVFHNNYTLGLTEENILSSLRTLATKLSAEEKSLRHQMKEEKEATVAEIKDRVSRAYGILLHSYQLEVVEALESVSLLKLGLDLDWVKGVSQATLNQLLFSCRRAHLICHFGDKMNQEEIPHRRAEFVHKSLKGVELLI